MRWLLLMVSLVVFLLNFLCFYAMNHVRTHCGIQPTAIVGITVTEVVTARVVGWTMRFKVMVVGCVESVLIVDEDFSVSRIVLIFVFKTFFLSLGSINCSGGMLGKIHL